jgi:hypothetical protein
MDPSGQGMWSLIWHARSTISSWLLQTRSPGRRAAGGDERSAGLNLANRSVVVQRYLRIGRRAKDTMWLSR